MDYGGQINRLGWLDILGSTKNRLITRHQYRILKYFAGMPFQSQRSKLFARMARRLVGGYIYSIKLEINDDCNLHCKMCYVDKKHQNLSKALIFSLLDQIRNFGIRLEILGGEPLMRKDIFEIIKYAKTRARVPFISLYTNGTVITREVAEGLKAAGLDAILVTLVSHQAHVHDEFTGSPGSWKKSTEGIRAAQKAGIETYSFTTVHSYNRKHYKEIYRFVKDELKVHSLFYQYISQQKDDPLMINPGDWHRIKKWILLDSNIEHMKFVRDFYLLTGNACSGGNFVFTVKADGSVQPCPFIYDIPLGNIKQQSIWEIFRNRFKCHALKEFKSLPEECRPCAYRSVCGGGCKAGNDKQCKHFNCMDMRCLGPFRQIRNHEDIMADIPTFF